MPSYFTSDVHLRLDRPERSQRFARWVDGLEASDRLTIVGDLCDFWFAARQYRSALAECPGLQALAAFREKGGALTILPGNHDAWLGPYYQTTLGARFEAEPLVVEDHGLRLYLLHGQWLGGHPVWKGWMESRAFLSAFRSFPASLASTCDHLLERRNNKARDSDDSLQLTAYRRHVQTLAETTDLAVIGHIHRSSDDHQARPRLIVPGGWFGQSSYVRIDSSGAALFVNERPIAVQPVE